MGETLAALEAAAAERFTTVSVIRAVLARIAEDEGRHAALACRFVRWANTVGGSRVHAAARDGFLAAVQRCREEVPLVSTTDDARSAHGRLSGPERHAVRGTAVVEVLEPLATDLFGAL